MSYDDIISTEAWIISYGVDKGYNFTYDAAAQLQRAITAMVYAANACGDDLDKYCADMPMGEGRLLDCINRNEKRVSKRCLNALTETGLK